MDIPNETANNRQDKVTSLIKELSAKFLAGEANRTSLITITSCTASPDLKRATIFFTVLPEGKEAEALGFMKRKRGELRDYIKSNMSTKIIPFIEVAIDKGEKNRQKIDELLRENN